MSDRELLREAMELIGEYRMSIGILKPSNLDLLARITAHLAALKSQPVPVEPMSWYDAGFLNDYGGGNVGWWQDYIRAELGRAEEFYQQQFDALQSALQVALERETMRLAGISTAAIGYWKEGDSIHPDYDTQALRDVANLYERYSGIVKDLRKMGAKIQCSTGGTFENDPPDAIVAIIQSKFDALRSALARERGEMIEDVDLWKDAALDLQESVESIKSENRALRRLLAEAIDVMPVPQLHKTMPQWTGSKREKVLAFIKRADNYLRG